MCTIGLASLVGVIPTAAAAAALANQTDADVPTSGAAQVKAVAAVPAAADRDGDRVSDDFEAALLAAAPSTPFDVIIRTRSGLASLSQGGLVGPFTVRRELPIIHGFAATVTARQALALAADTGTIRVDRDAPVRLANDGDRADFGVDHAAMDFGVSGAGVGICVIDSGADPNHEQLDSKVSAARWLDLINHLPVPYDDHNNGVGGHGTHVASIAVGDGIGGPLAAQYRGVAPGAELYVVKAFPGAIPDGLPVILPSTTQESVTVAAIEWCANQDGVDVISMSFTKVGPTDGTDPLGVAVDTAVTEHDKVAVAAAGNDGPHPGLLGSPGAAANAIAVGATAEWSLPVTAPNRSDGPFLPAFSSRGPTLDGRIKPDVVAPGHTTYAAWSGTVAGYLDKSGTSMATPFVSGALALALERNPELSHADLAVLVQATAIDRGPVGKDNDWGAGMIDVFGLVSRVDGSAVYDPTPFPTHAVLTGSTSPVEPWTFSFVLGAGDLAIPIAATILADGAPDASGAFWDPNLQATLTDPLGAELDMSDCPLLRDPNDCLGNTSKTGRQELLRSLPTVAGTYTITVEPSSLPALFGSLTGGSFLVDLSHGPVVASSLPPGCTTRWIGGAGSWYSPTRWSAGVVPLPTDFACIPSGGDVTHSLGASSVRGVFVDGRLSIDGGSMLNLTDSAAMSIVAGQLAIGAASLVSAATELDLRGVLSGTGTFDGDVANQGDVMPGGTGVGVFSIVGDYRQLDAGVLSVNVNGTSTLAHDVLSVSGSASLGGDLAIATGYSAARGDDVEILDVAGTRSSSWSRVFGAQLGAGLAWIVDSSSDAPDVHLRVAQGSPGTSGKVAICHLSGTPAERTMFVPQQAANAHARAHGDTLGACA